MNEEHFRQFQENLLNRMGSAGWIAGHAYIDGKGFTVNWTPEGQDHAETVKRLIKLNQDYIEQPPKPFGVPPVIAATEIWKLIVKKAAGNGKPLTQFEEDYLYHLLTQLSES